MKHKIFPYCTLLYCISSDLLHGIASVNAAIRRNAVFQATFFDIGLFGGGITNVCVCIHQLSNIPQ